MLLTNFATNDISFLRCNNFLPTNVIKFQIKVYKQEYMHYKM